MRTSTTRCGLALMLAVSASLAFSAAHAQDVPATSDAVQQVSEAREAARLATEAAQRAAQEADRARVTATQAQDEANRISRSIAHSRDRAEAAASTAEHVARGAILSPTLLENCTAGFHPLNRFRRGGSGDRRCVLVHLRAQRQQTLMLTADSREADWPELLQSASILSDYYLARSNRQQAVMDFGASTTALGALGAGLSGPAGAQTASLWGYGALFGVVLVNFTGSQPTRDLHFAGHLGVEYVVNRYVVMNNRLVVLKELTPRRGNIDEPGVCESAETQNSVSQMLTEVERWPTGDDKSAFLPVLQQMNEICARLRAGEDQFARIERLADQYRLEWPAAFASDLLSLDNRVTERDARLRLTPGSAISAAAVAPLRVIDSMISGENTQEAVNRVRINALLDDMTVNLRPMAIPAAPENINLTMLPRTEIRARSQRTDRAEPALAGHPSNTRAREMASLISRYAESIENARSQHNDQTLAASELHAAARRSVLTFDYVVETGVAEVSLEEPAQRTERTGASAARDDDGQVVAQPVA